MSRLAAPLWLAHALRVQRGPMPWGAVTRGALAAGPLLLAGVGTGHTALGVLAAIAAMLAGINDRLGSRRASVERLGVPALAGALGLLAGTYAGRGLAAVPLTVVLTLLGLAAGGISAVGAVASAAGTQLLVGAAIGAGMPAAESGWQRALAFLAGAGWLLVLRFALPTPGSLAGDFRFGGERAAVAEVYDAVAALLDAVGGERATARRAALTAALDHAQDVFAGPRLRRYVGSATERRLHAQFAAALPLAEAATALLWSEEPVSARTAEGPRRLAAAVRGNTSPGPLPAPHRSAPALRALDDALLHAAEAFDRGESADRGLVGRRRGIGSALHAALGTGGREYGLRVSVCFGAAAAIAQALHHTRWYGQHQHWYWLPATTVFLVKPDLGPLASRVLCRAAGTVLGALVFAGLAALLPRPAGLIALVAVCGALLPVATRHFAAQTAVVTVLVLALVMAGGEPQASVSRIGETLLACALVLLVGHLPMPAQRGGRVRARLAAAGSTAHAYLVHVLGESDDRTKRWALRREAYRTLAEARTVIALAAAELPALARHTAGTDAVADALERLVDTTTACAVHLDDTGRLTARHIRQLWAALDELKDLFQVLMATRLLNAAKRKTEKERLSMLPQLEKASRTLAQAAKVLFEELELVEEQEADLDVAALWAAVEEVAPRAAVMSAAATVVTLVPEDENTADVAMRAALATRYATVRPFLALLGESKALDAASAGKRVLAGVRGLPALARRKVGVKPLLPREVDDKLVPPAWRKAVYANPDLPQGAVDRDAYVVCVLEQLHRALNNRDVFASPSHRWSNPRARLLEGPDWNAVEEDVLAALSLDMPVTEHLAELVRGLDAGWKQLAERLTEAGPAAKVSIEVQDDGRVKLNVDKLGALGEPKSLTWLRKRVEKMLPKIDLPDLLFEVNAWTGFLDAFVHLGDGTTRMKDLPTSMVALLVSEACNIGLTPVVNPGYEALTRARLVHVDQYYLRADTIAAANAALIAAQAGIPIVQFWGEGLLASVDGLRFQVPVRTINAAPSPKYFGFKRGIIWLNAVNDQVAGIGQMVVPGTPRDSLHILDALLNLDGGVKPEMVATDNASYSDMVFGLFKILGYNFSPRFRDLDDQRFWRATMPGVETGTYGPVEDLARNRVNLNKVITHWPDMLKVAGSLVTNQVRAYDLLRMSGRDGRPTPLGAAFAEYGRVAKTEHLLRVVDPVDDTYRRQMNRQLTVQESRHKLARDVCHGKRGTIHQAYRDGMEDQLGALGLVLNAIVLWTTKYIDAAVEALRAEGHEIRDEDIARLSPLKHSNLNLLGRYSFTASIPAAGALRPLRDPDAVELDENDDGIPE